MRGECSQLGIGERGPRVARQEPHNDFGRAAEDAILCNALHGVLRTGRFVAAEAVGVQRTEDAVVRRERVLVAAQECAYQTSGEARRQGRRFVHDFREG